MKTSLSHPLLLFITVPLMTGSGCSSIDLLSPPPPSGAAPAPVPESFQLSSGLPVWLIPSDAVPLVTVSLVIRRGSASDPPGKAGLASLTADMLDEGAGSRGALEIADEIDFLGAELSIDVDREQTRILLEVLKKNLEPALDLLADIVLRPRFEEKDWERVHALALNTILQRREEPRQVARLAADRAFFGDDHPFAHPVEGYESSVKGITLEEVKGFHRAHFVPGSAILVVAGDASRNGLLAALEARLAPWRGEAGSRPALPAVEPASRLIIVDRPDAPQTEMRLLLPAPPFGSPRVPGLMLANTILGGTFTSRLMSNLRERNQFTYGASSMMTLRSAPAYVAIGSAVHSEKTLPALVEVFRELRAMESGELTADEIQKARSTIWSRLVEALESQEGTMAVYAPSAALGQDPAERRELYRRLATVPRDSVLAESRAAFVWGKATIVLVGDRKLIERQIEEVRAHPPLDAGGKAFLLPSPALRGKEGEILDR